jgi:hypothetical protein
VSTTDPEDALMMASGQRAAFGHHDHDVVDGGKARIILHALITPADVMENAPMLDQLRRVIVRWRLRPDRVGADTASGTVENIRALEDQGIRAYVLLPDDEYRCPQGRPLRRRAVGQTEESVVYRAEAATCNACPLKAACTASEHGRTVRRSFHEAHLDRVRGYHATTDYRRAMHKRQVWREPLFAEAKWWRGLRRFRLRGLGKVNYGGPPRRGGPEPETLAGRDGLGPASRPDREPRGRLPGQPARPSPGVTLNPCARAGRLTPLSSLAAAQPLPR